MTGQDVLDVVPGCLCCGFGSSYASPSELLYVSVTVIATPARDTVVEVGMASGELRWPAAMKYGDADAIMWWPDA